MELNIGDRVRFLNEKGQGVVSRRINKNTVGVTIEDGFEIPYLINELISLEKSNSTEKHVIKKMQEPVILESEKHTINTIKQPERGVYVVFTLENPNNITYSDFNVWLINHTSYQVFYTFSLQQQGKYKLVEKGELFPKQDFLIETVSRKDLHEYANVKIDAVFYSEQPYEMRLPMSEIIKLKPIKLYKENAFVTNFFIRDKAFVIPALLFDRKLNAENIQLQLQDAFQNRDRISQSNKISKPHIFNDPTKIMEVDLHIEELLDDYSGMSNFEIVQVQLKAFQNALDKAIEQHIRSLTVIHGIGTGRLKKEIIQLLITTYPKILYRDASYAKYGMGATEVILH